MVSACSPNMIVQTDHIRPSNLDRLKTFRFAEEAIQNNISFNEANQERIKLYITEELQKRGYIESQLADFEVSILGAVDMKRVSQTSTPFYYNPYYPGYWQDRRPENTNDVALIVNVLSGGELVWQGVATGNLQKKKKQHIEAAIADVVKRIFEEFPYESKI